jgi:hypothetical protein
MAASPRRVAPPSYAATVGADTGPTSSLIGFRGTPSAVAHRALLARRHTTPAGGRRRSSGRRRPRGTVRAEPGDGQFGSRHGSQIGSPHPIPVRVYGRRLAFPQVTAIRFAPEGARTHNLLIRRWTPHDDGGRFTSIRAGQPHLTGSPASAVVRSTAPVIAPTLAPSGSAGMRRAGQPASRSFGRTSRSAVTTASCTVEPSAASPRMACRMSERAIVEVGMCFV